MKSKLPKQSRWRCHTCGDTLRSWAAAERHADDYSHHRIELVL